jgi:hypothetical protein
MRGARRKSRRAEGRIQNGDLLVLGEWRMVAEGGSGRDRDLPEG